MIDELIARVREAPDDDAPRLVLADKLMEAGDPWGEVIALSCKQARLGDTPEADALRERVNRVKKELWPTDAFAGAIKRGFFELVWANDAGVSEVRGLAFALLRRLRVRELSNKGLTALAELAFDLDELRLDADRRVDPLQGHLLAAALLGMRCRRLSLTHIAFEREHLDAVLAGPVAEGLRDMELTHPSLSGMLEGVAWPRLEALDLALRLQSSDVVTLLRSPQLLDLAALDLSHNPIDDGGARAIAATPFTRLKRLELMTSDLTSAGVVALADAPALRGLTKLALSANYDGFEDSVARLGVFTALTDLEIEGRMSPVAVRTFFENVRAPLRSLLVKSASLYGTDCLPVFERVRELRVLDLSFNSVGDDGATALAAADLPHLEKLELTTCHIGPEGARALAESQTLPRTLELGLWGNPIREYEDALRKRYAKVTLGGP